MYRHVITEFLKPLQGLWLTVPMLQTVSSINIHTEIETVKPAKAVSMIGSWLRGVSSWLIGKGGGSVAQNTQNREAPAHNAQLTARRADNQ